MSDEARSLVMKLLRLDSSILGTASVSRILSCDFVEAQCRLHHGIEARAQITAMPE